jgi:hypothetical protein
MICGHSLNRLGAMGLQWKDLPVRIQERLEQALFIKAENMNEVGLSCFMKGSVAMDYEWSKRERVKEMIFGRLKNLYNGENGQTRSGRGIANMIFCLGELNSKWKELPSDIQGIIFNGIERCGSSFDSQAVSIIIFG